MIARFFSERRTEIFGELNALDMHETAAAMQFASLPLCLANCGELVIFASLPVCRIYICGKRRTEDWPRKLARWNQVRMEINFPSGRYPLRMKNYATEHNRETEHVQELQRIALNRAHGIQNRNCNSSDVFGDSFQIENSMLANALHFCDTVCGSSNVRADQHSNFRSSMRLTCMALNSAPVRVVNPFVFS